MVWWIALGTVVFALLLLMLVVLRLLRGLNRFNRVLRRLQSRVVEAQRLQPAGEALQRRAEAMQETMQSITDRAELLRAKTGARRPRAKTG